MFFLIGLFIKFILLALGVLFVVAGVKKWSWFSKLVFGKKNKEVLGDSMANLALILIGGLAAVIALMWIF
jgi:hypothetical protein